VLVSVKQLALDPWTFVIAWTVGLASVVASAWLPAHAAAQMEPVRALHGGNSFRGGAVSKPVAENRGALRPLTKVAATPQVGWKGGLESAPPGWLWSGLFSILFAAAFSLLALSTGPPWLGFVAAFLILTGFSLFVPWAISRLSSVAGRCFRALRRHWGKAALEAELGAANLSRALLRNSITIVALAAAVAMTVGVSVMVFSFRKTVETWINHTLIADLFIAPASNEIVGPSSFFPPAAVQFLASHPAVETIDTFREMGMPMGEETAAVAVVRGSERRQFQFVRGDARRITRRFQEEPCVLVSESFSRRHRLHDGESIQLTTPDGIREFPIAGIFYDYSHDQGIVYMSARTFVQFWHDDRVNSVAVYLRKAGSGEALTADFRKQFNRDGQFMIYSNQSLRTRVFEIFDQTFAVTYVLRTIAVVVAITGIFLSLTILIAERSRELAIVRAIGGSAAQIRKLLLWETAMLGALAAAIGLASGLCLSLVLTGVINRAFFGWTIQLAFPWRSLALTPLWIFAAAVAAGILPAWRAGRLVLAESLRNE